MLQAIKELLGSKKFWMTLIGSATVGGLHYAGVNDTIVAAVGALFGINIGAQGLADFKKNALK